MAVHGWPIFHGDWMVLDAEECSALPVRGRVVPLHVQFHNVQELGRGSGGIGDVVRRKYEDRTITEHQALQLCAVAQVAHLDHTLSLGPWCARTLDQGQWHCMVRNSPRCLNRWWCRHHGLGGRDGSTATGRTVGCDRMMSCWVSDD